MLRSKQVNEYLKQMQGIKVLVVGDLMIDEYLWGATDRISPEAPVPIVDIKREQYTLGGAGNVVRNLVDLGAGVSVCSIIGSGVNGRMLLQLFEELGVDCEGVEVDRSRSSSKKTRLMAASQQVIRIDRETRQPISEAQGQKIVDYVAAHIVDFKAVILSDYAKGILTDEVAQGIISLAKSHGVPVLVDPKGRDYAKYSGATVVTPNESEAEAASHLVIVDEDTFMRLGQSLREQHDFDNLVITRSEKGMSIFPKDGEPVNLPTRAREVYDVTGAGDTAISTLGLGIAAGIPLYDSANLANITAGIVVGKVGTSTTNPHEIMSYFDDQAPAHVMKVKTREEIEAIVRELRASGRKIVFTNGCFDLLHVGHIIYLQKARRRGDLLILGLNSDDSVSRLKGEKRPLINQEERAQVLAALDCIDYIVVFSEDTPLELLEIVSPHVLVKGGDYRPEEIVGRELVQSYGGVVEVIPFVEGRSTTDLINSILERFGENGENGGEFK